MLSVYINDCLEKIDILATLHIIMEELEIDVTGTWIVTPNHMSRLIRINAVGKN